jgi:leader peptidase (prepilin peptidase)/N-methyltransferase
MNPHPTQAESILALKPASVVTAALGLSGLAIGRFGFGPRGLVAVFVLCTLVALSAIDLEHRVLPNRIVLPATAIVLAAQVAFFPGRSPEWILAAVGAAFVLFLPLLFYPGGMGMGDVKLALLLGAALGRDVIGALALGAVAAVPVAVWLLVRGGREARKTAFPFGPFLALGAAVVILAAEAP